MKSLTELEQKRSLLLTEATAALRSDKSTEERHSIYDAKVAEMGAVEAEIKRHRDAEKLEGEERARQEAAEQALRSGRPPLPQPGKQGSQERELSKEEIETRNKEQKRAFGHYLRTKDDSQLRAMSSGTGSQGGYTIPTATEPQLEQALLAFGGVAPFLDQFPTNTGETINFPLNNDTSNMGSEIAENTAATEQDLVIGTTASTVGLHSTGSVLIPRTLLRDSVVDLASIVVAALAVRRARLMSNRIINGSQNSATCFSSLLTGATSGGTSAAPTAIALGDLSALYGNVDPGYAVDGNFVMHRSTQIYLSTLRNSYGTPIFPLDADGMLRKIFGQNIVIDQNMPAVVSGAPAASQKLILFGNLKKYKLRLVGSLEVMRLDERYAEYNQVGFMGWWSGGGNLLDAGTHPIQYLVQHA